MDSGTIDLHNIYITLHRYLLLQAQNSGHFHLLSADTRPISRAEQAQSKVQSQPLQMPCSGLFRNYTPTRKGCETEAQTAELFAQVARLVRDGVWHRHLALETLALPLSPCSLPRRDTVSQSELQQCVT